MSLSRPGLGTSFVGLRGLPPLLQNVVPWIKMNPATVATAIAVCGSISKVVGVAESIGREIYLWGLRCFTASVTIYEHDRLQEDVIRYIESQVLEKRRGTRAFIASTGLQNQHLADDGDDDYVEADRKAAIVFSPVLKSTWFFRNKNFYLVKVEHAEPSGFGSLVVMCLGHSVSPIKQFLKDCQAHAELDSGSYTRVISNSKRGDRWDNSIMRPQRALSTVHFDEEVKADLIADIKNYLDPSNRRFYQTRGIPYRRGYLLHGPPGTGKTSLSLAVAGHFNLDLFLIHVPSVQSDSSLEQLFVNLPKLCVVLLEDIDAIGLSRQPARSTESDDEDDSIDQKKGSRSAKSGSKCTLSGLLNVLDGVASQEGRIILMTSNCIHDLDEALIRPGRVDKQVYLGRISQKTAQQMFMGMYKPEETSTDLLFEEQARAFASCIPEDIFTPATIQGYLLLHRESPANAAERENVMAWVEEESSKTKRAENRTAKTNQKTKGKKAVSRKEQEKAEKKTDLEAESDDSMSELHPDLPTRLINTPPNCLDDVSDETLQAFKDQSRV